jgi:hypothetical protein
VVTLNVSPAMRPQFDNKAVFRRPMVARFCQIGPVKLQPPCRTCPHRYEPAALQIDKLQQRNNAPRLRVWLYGQSTTSATAMS